MAENAQNTQNVENMDNSRENNKVKHPITVPDDIRNFFNRLLNEHKDTLLGFIKYAKEEYETKHGMFVQLDSGNSTNANEYIEAQHAFMESSNVFRKCLRIYEDICGLVEGDNNVNTRSKNHPELAKFASIETEISLGVNANRQKQANKRANMQSNMQPNNNVRYNGGENRYNMRNNNNQHKNFNGRQFNSRDNTMNNTMNNTTQERNTQNDGIRRCNNRERGNFNGNNANTPRDNRGQFNNANRRSNSVQRRYPRRNSNFRNGGQSGRDNVQADSPSSSPMGKARQVLPPNDSQHEQST